MLLSLAVVASGCGGRLDLPEEPDVPKAVRYELSAQVSSLSDVYVWKEGSAVGVYGSSKGDNAKYVPYNGFHGKTGLVELYGPEVDGTIYGYFPYNQLLGIFFRYILLRQPIRPYTPTYPLSEIASYPHLQKFLFHFTSSPFLILSF